MSRLYRQCLILIQAAFCCMSICAQEKVIVHSAFTEFAWKNPRLVLLFNTQKKKRVAGRGPASAIPSDDLEALPIQEEIWLSNVFVEDRAGVMSNMKRTLDEWERMEEYRRSWDIGSTGLYDTPDRERKKAWFNRMILRYADKRFTGELKNAEAGSTLQKVRNVKQALRPNTEAKISKNFKLKFKARLIQMRAFMRVVNPWVESETTFSASGRVSSRISKEFKDYGFRTDLNFQLNDGHWEARVTKPITKTVRAVVSSRKNEGNNNTVQLIYSKGF